MTTRITMLGAGFAGLELSTLLSQALVRGVEVTLIDQGDAFVFGGPARLRYHGVSRILPHTAPSGLDVDGRYNLTLRRY